MEQDAVKVCRRLGGVARTSAIRRCGVTARALADAVAKGSLIQPRRGLYALPNTSPAIVEALAHRGVIACATAAREHGLWTLDHGEDEPSHVWVDPHRHPAHDARTETYADFPSEDYACGCLVHRDTPNDPPSLTVVGVLHCLVQLAICLGGEAFFAALESALNQRMLRAGDLAIVRRGVPRTMAWLVDFAEATSQSGLESLLRLRLHALGISLATQVSIPSVGIVDFVIGGCLILEADGDGNHAGSKRHKDLRRDAVAMSMGYITLRFDSALIIHDWSVVEAAIIAALDRGLHRIPEDLNEPLAALARSRRVERRVVFGDTPGRSIRTGVSTRTTRLSIRDAPSGST